ncbi:hypothetical protein COU54_05125 [Candidatus Pacearchaeota archaeon CG10_big_fil_rev_8_21_14_0_10_31_24]|nr:MAG: hypothetical protein COU54_05125 [Candidatus Pacearchaeota archaeon CG10_big_fil_rev_8_21_14_0_10_31_24]
MSFGSLLSKSWKDYTLNLTIVFKLMFLFFIFPLIVTFGLITYISFSTGIVVGVQEAYDIYDSVVTRYSPSDFDSGIVDEEVIATEYGPRVEELVSRLIGPVLLISIVGFLMLIGSSFLSILGFLGIIVPEFGKKNYKEILKSARSKYWGFVGLLILFGLIVMAVYIGLALIMATIIGIISLGSQGLADIGGFFIILIILAIVYLEFHLMFSVFIFVYGEKGVIDSLGASWKLVAKNRWKVIGYSLLLILINWVISMILFFVSFIGAGSMTAVGNISGAIMIYVALNIIFLLLASLLIYPVMILFFKNLYLELKGKK